ncbi:MAG: SUF system Fe-S cluster assembly protein [Pseudomonadota bacterium]
MTDTAAPAGEFDPETGARNMSERDMIDLSRPAAEKPSVPTSEPVSEVEVADITQSVIKALKTVFDPEIPVDIYELGLIYRVDYDPATEDKGAKITVDMTLTAPGCPVAGEMPGWVEDAVLTVEGIDDVSVNMTFDPPWSPERMSEEAKLELGWM